MLGPASTGVGLIDTGLRPPDGKEGNQAQSPTQHAVPHHAVRWRPAVDSMTFSRLLLGLALLRSQPVTSAPQSLQSARGLCKTHYYRGLKTQFSGKIQAPQPIVQQRSYVQRSHRMAERLTSLTAPTIARVATPARVG